MHRRTRKLLLATTALMPLSLSPGLANPLGGQVVGGDATIQGQGTASVTVNQSSNRAIINWNTFNIGVGEKTQFIQPSSSSVALNRVTGGLGPSQIFGSLKANGQVFVVNPDGILIGPGAKIDTAGFLATTHDIANADFMAGRYNFSIPGNPAASVVNQGTITAQSGGFAALVAPGVRNSGTISARLGRVALASGNAFSLDFYGDSLITLGVSDAVAADVKDVATGKSLASLVDNSGKLKANGGTVELTAVSARRVVDSVINTSGVIEAHTIGTHNGRIVLGAPTAGAKVAGAPVQSVKVAGKLSVSGKRSGTAGGKIVVIGEDIVLAAANLDASGDAGGGTVLIGGDTGGGHPSQLAMALPQARLDALSVPTATTVSVDATSAIDASAKASGDGGKVVVWSNEATSYAGSIAARGGAQAGDGGFVEVSGKELNFGGISSTLAPQGLAGALLLDPLNATIAATPGSQVITVAAIQNALANNASVTVEPNQGGSEPGDLTVASDISWSTSNALVLAANRNIVINDGIVISNLSGGHNPLLTLRADLGSTGTGTVTFNGSSKIDFSQQGGFASIYYNPAGGYSHPVDYSSHFVRNPLLPSKLTAYMLVNSAAALQNIQSNLTGTYALGRDIDATGFTFTPIGSLAAPFKGVLVGDHTVSNLTITSTAPDVGLFGVTDFGSVVTRLGLSNVDITALGGSHVGGLAGTNNGNLADDFVTGTVRATPFGTGCCGTEVGLLAGVNGGFIVESYAIGNVGLTAVGGSYPPGFNTVGGLIGVNSSSLMSSYTEPLSISGSGATGQLAGWNNGSINSSYATVGGNSLVGVSLGIESGSAAVSSATLQAGLPSGFDPSIWSTKPTINAGLPSLYWQQSASASTINPQASSAQTNATASPSTNPAALASITNQQYTNIFAPIEWTTGGQTTQAVYNASGPSNSANPIHSISLSNAPEISPTVSGNRSSNATRPLTSAVNSTGCPDQIDCGFLKQDNIEGYLSYPYIKMDDFGKVAGASGVAIGLGIDFGSGNVNSKDFANLPPVYQALFAAVSGKSGQAAVSSLEQFATQNDLAVKIDRYRISIPSLGNDSAADTLFQAVAPRYSKQLEVAWAQDATSNVKYMEFKKLPEEIQTVLFSLIWNGKLHLNQADKVWSNIISNNWGEAISAINAIPGWSGRHPQEAQLIQQAIDRGCLTSCAIASP